MQGIEMTGRELLERAAKAAGLVGVEIHDTPMLGLHVWAQSLFHERGSGVWNPLADDGHAFRLMVDLQMAVDVNVHECEVFKDGQYWSSEAIVLASDFVPAELATDPRAASRRAIVRAAAAMADKDFLEMSSDAEVKK